MKKLFLLFVVLFILSGCATYKMVSYHVTSVPSKAPIDVNGMSVGVTPTTAELQCVKKWVGIINSPDGWGNASGKYEITAYPPQGFKGQSQTKHIDPCQWLGTDNPGIQFDLGLEKVTPTQKIEIKTIDGNNNSEVKESIEALKTLRDSGVLSESEYNEKILDLVK